MSESKVPEAFLTRRMVACASHRLHSKHLSNEENKTLYGKCNHPNGHGHNYIIKVTVRGPIDVKTGMVFDAAKLKQYMTDTVMKAMDHKCLDKDIPFFDDRPSTVENVALFVWQLMESCFKKEKCSLYKIKVHETENIFAIYKGNTV